MTITSKTYQDIQTAYDHFNTELFNNTLPEVLLTLVPHKSAYGYFRHEAFAVKNPKTGTTIQVVGKDKKPHIIHELALNPFSFGGRTDDQIMSTLVHEMVHLWQSLHGKAPKKPGHNREWADKMKSVGLQPSTTGKPGGKETGRRCSHYIIENGLFAKSAKRCKIKFTFSGTLVVKEKKGSKRTKYTCPMCEKNAYGTDDLNIQCADCDELMQRQ
jgi:predicted SprT family Zn-dependent metalloprotease